MSYPIEVIHGAGVPKFTHPAFGTVTLTDTADTKIVPIPVRFDGGPVMITLSNGRVISRVDGYRYQITFIWAYLSTANAKLLQTVVNTCKQDEINVQPHQDIGNWYKMIYDLSEGIDIDSPGGMYLGHAPTVRFIGTRIITDLSNKSGDGSLSNTPFRPRIV